MKKYIPHILGAIFVLVIIGAWMLIAHLVKKPSETQVPNGFHWDVTDQRHMLNVAPILEEQTELSVELLKTLLQ